MELKQYQEKTLEILARYTQAMRDEQALMNKRGKVLKAGGCSLSSDDRNIAKRAWEKISKIDHIKRTSADGESIPHVCMEIPTGGGKTLLGVAALKHLLTPEAKFVLWVVPSNAIYDQTLKAFRTHAHPYRKKLAWITGKKIKLFEKDDDFTQKDLDQHVCLMLLKFPAINREKNKDFLKIYRDSNSYHSMFPDEQNILAQQQLLQKYPDLEQDENRARHSLFNVLKIIRPIIVLDEAHKAYKEEPEQNKNFVNTLNRLNPRFVLELSATPKSVSNILVKISGEELEREEMIKMPLEIHNQKQNNWQKTLESAYNKQQELEANTQNLESKTQRYIHPIVLVRVEHTGKLQREKNTIHAEDVKDYLIKNLSVHASSIRIQSSEKKELKGENLTESRCAVRWIITKDALKEGWDCAFAYILVLLDNTRAPRAVTQMVGRVLRQPNAQKVEEDETLNRCYIYCNRLAVAETLKIVRQGLKDEGLIHVKNILVTDHDIKESDRKKRIIKRRAEYEDAEIFLPRVLHKDEETKNEWRSLNYERDILAWVAWKNLNIDKVFSLEILKNEKEDIREVDIHGEETELKATSVLPVTKFLLSDFTKSLIDIIPNPWQAARIANNFLEGYKAQGYDETTLAYNREDLISNLKTALTTKIMKRTKKIFEEKVYQKNISFHLKVDKKFRYEMEKSFKFYLAPDEIEPLTNEESNLLQKNLFKPVFKHHFNKLEGSFAIYLDNHKTLEWWHRVASTQDYRLQGWQKNFVRPDFVAVRKDKRIFVFETKGDQFKGNDDTNYKEDLLNILENASKHIVEGGKIETPSVTLRILFQSSWKNDANRALTS